MPPVCFLIPGFAVKKLSELRVAECGEVVRIDVNLRKPKKFADVGLVKGAQVAMEAHAPFGGLLRIQVLESSLSLHCDDAAHFWVRIQEGNR